MTSDEKFFAWLDGELDGAEAAEMEAEVASDPRLSRLAKEHRALAARLRSAFDQLAEAPVPERLAESLRRPTADVADFAAVAAARERRRRDWVRSRQSLPQWAAMAATLVFGVVIGTLVAQPDSSPLEVEGAALYASASLDKALDSRLASAPAKGDVRIGLTFRDHGGSICRSFAAAQASGLACREDGRWQVRGLFAAPEGQASDYRMASGVDPNLAALIDSTMASEPFDAAMESSARDKGWR
ncbi:MAG TPA: anti-sigma factor [Sphingomicrobium sp.]|nr:anti-sigma factor [Sphingomicrobium sp.]